MSDLIKRELKEASTFWCKKIHEALMRRFGKNRCGYILILFEYGTGSSLTYSSDGTPDSMVKLMRETADLVAKGQPLDRKIIYDA